jgi:hypothetical protein
MSHRITVDVALDGDAQACEPGDRVAGTASWTAEKAPDSVEVRLFWYTKGKGDQDLAVVETVVLDAPSATDRRPFSFRLPAAPPSFRGDLVELVWAIEVVALPGEEAALRELVVGPGGRAVDLRADAPNA